MKRILFTFIIGLLLVNAAAADTIHLASDVWSPFSCDPDSDHPGVSVEIARAVFALSNHTVEYQTMPWARALQEVERGKIDAVVDVAPRGNFGLVFPKEPINEQRACFYTLPETKWFYTGPDSLRTVTIGVVSGYHYGDEVDPYLSTAKKDQQVHWGYGKDALEKNIRMLKRERFSVLIEDPVVMAHLLMKHSDYGPLRTAGCTSDKDKLYMVFSPENPESLKYAKEFDRNIRKLRDMGVLDEIRARYGVHADR